MNLHTKDAAFVNFNNEPMSWVNFNGVRVWEAISTTIGTATPPLKFKSTGHNLVSYKIYGNTGVGVGDESTEYGSPYIYKIPVHIKNQNLFNYKKPEGQNLLTMKSTANGAIVDGTNNPPAYSVSGGWFFPGKTDSSGNALIFTPKTVVTVSALITAMAWGLTGLGYKMKIGLLARGSTSPFYSGLSEISPSLNQVLSARVTFTIPSNFLNKPIHPLFALNTHQFTIRNIQVEYGTATTFVKYDAPQIINLFVKEPLRKLGDVADYIDFKKKKVIRLISSDGSSLLETPVVEDAILAPIPTIEGYTTIDFGTTLKPSLIEMERRDG